MTWKSSLNFPVSSNQPYSCLLEKSILNFALFSFKEIISAEVPLMLPDIRSDLLITVNPSTFT